VQAPSRPRDRLGLSFRCDGPRQAACRYIPTRTDRTHPRWNHRQLRGSASVRLLLHPRVWGPTDSDGREPLLTKGNGRIGLSTLQKIAYKWTRPCAVGLGCLHDRDPEDCEAAQQNNSAYKCPSSRAPHHIRTGYITDQKNRGVSSDAIDQRCDVSPRVQDQHYDLPDSTEERERFEDEFRDAEDAPDSGFDH
jgi:hypothetical protein